MPEHPHVAVLFLWTKPASLVVHGSAKNKKRIPVIIFHLFKHMHTNTHQAERQAVCLSPWHFCPYLWLSLTPLCLEKVSWNSWYPSLWKKTHTHEMVVSFDSRIAAIFLISASWRDPEGHNRWVIRQCLLPPKYKEHTDTPPPVKIGHCHLVIPGLTKGTI